MFVFDFRLKSIFANDSKIIVHFKSGPKIRSLPFQQQQHQRFRSSTERNQLRSDRRGLDERQQDERGSVEKRSPQHHHQQQQRRQEGRCQLDKKAESLARKGRQDLLLGLRFQG